MKLQELETIEFPDIDQLTGTKTDISFAYIPSTFCEAVANMLDNISAYMIARYSLTDRFDSTDTVLLGDDNKLLAPFFKNIEKLEKIENEKWYHTHYGRFCEDDVILVGESEENYWMVWLDKDVSDCCLTKISKKGCVSLEQFNKDVVEYFENCLKYKIRPIRRPSGWICW